MNRLDEPIQQLEGSGLSTRIINSLAVAGYKTIAELLEATPIEVERVKQVGPDRRREVIRAASKYLAGDWKPSIVERPWRPNQRPKLGHVLCK